MGATVIVDGLRLRQSASAPFKGFGRVEQRHKADGFGYIERRLDQGENSGWRYWLCQHRVH